MKVKSKKDKAPLTEHVLNRPNLLKYKLFNINFLSIKLLYKSKTALRAHAYGRITEVFSRAALVLHCFICIKYMFKAIVLQICDCTFFVETLLSYQSTVTILFGVRTGGNTYNYDQNQYNALGYNELTIKYFYSIS